MRLAIVLGSGAMLRVLWVIYAPSVPSSDASGYREIALNIATGNGYMMDGRATAWWVPGWPAWLAFWYRLGFDDSGIRALNVGLSLISILLTYGLALHLSNRRAAIIAAGITALLPSLVMLPEYLITENLAIPGLVATTWMVLRLKGRWPLVVGLCVGALVLIREQNTLTIGAVGLHWLVTLRPWQFLLTRLALMLVGALLVVSPWIIRNTVDVGVPWLATTSGIALHVAFNPANNGLWVNPDWKAWATTTEQQNEAFYFRFGRETGLRFATENPGSLLDTAPTKLANYLLGDCWMFDFGVDATGNLILPMEDVLRIFILDGVFYLALLAAATLGFHRLCRTPVAPLLAGLILLPIGLHLFIYGYGRFHAPLIPIWAALAGVAFSFEGFRINTPSPVGDYEHTCPSSTTSST